MWYSTVSYGQLWKENYFASTQEYSEFSIAFPTKLAKHQLVSKVYPFLFKKSHWHFELFDFLGRVPHICVVKYSSNFPSDKLEHYGFRGHALGSLSSYQSDTKQYTPMEDTPYETQSTLYGLQWSILCPLLFLLYINDIQNCTTNLHFRSFSDDTAVFLHGDDPEKITTNRNNEMKILCIGITLTNWNVASIKGTELEKKDICEIKIGKDCISRTEYTKHIGLTIDETLTWEYQVNEICNFIS